MQSKHGLLRGWQLVRERAKSRTTQNLLMIDVRLQPSNKVPSQTSSKHPKHSEKSYPQQCCVDQLLDDVKTQWATSNNKDIEDICGNQRDR